jgi:hypothetical protein
MKQNLKIGRNLSVQEQRLSDEVDNILGNSQRSIYYGSSDCQTFSHESPYQCSNCMPQVIMLSTQLWEFRLLDAECLA